METVPVSPGADPIAAGARPGAGDRPEKKIKESFSAVSPTFPASEAGILYYFFIILLYFLNVLCHLQEKSGRGDHIGQ